MGDLISRQDALDAISCDITITGKQNAEVVAETIASFVDRIKALPSAQQETSILTVTVAPDTEEIERVARKIKDASIMVLPSAESERKKGKWIDAVLPNDSGGLQVQVCDQCNTFFPLAYTGGGHNFCPNCGADMRERRTDVKTDKGSSC